MGAVVCSRGWVIMADRNAQAHSSRRMASRSIRPARSMSPNYPMRSLPKRSHLASFASLSHCRSSARYRKGHRMPFATLDGIKTHYVRQGTGPVLLMMAPRGFESTLQSWEHGKWKDISPIEALSPHFTVVAYDRREAGQSGGRVEVLRWQVFAQHAKLLLEHLDIEKAIVLGVCMGVGVATQFACTYPEASLGLILVHPVGGHRWKVRTNPFFDRHIAFVRQHGLELV